MGGADVLGGAAEEVTTQASVTLSAINDQPQPWISPPCCYHNNMPRDQLHDDRSRRNGANMEEAEALLSKSSLRNDDPAPRALSVRVPHPNRRQSSFSKPPPHGQPRTPRTSNRVRFDIEEQENREEASNGHLQRNPVESPGWLEDEDFLPSQTPGSRGSSTGQRVPLLTGIEAPSVTVANTDLSFNVEDLLETARPKSGMRSAFMNMANSIM